jgi:hypothetical protein
MVDLDDRLLRDLARLRERASPPAGAEQRVRAALDAAIGPDPEGGGDGGGAASGDGGSGISGLGGSKLAIAGKVVAATLAATSVGLLVKLGVAPDRHPREVATPTVTIAETTSTNEPASQPKPEPEPPIVVTPRAKPPAPVQRPSELDEDPLTAEVTLLEQARAADDLAARLELLEQHRTRFEDGLLAAERESLRISTLCELDQLDAARRAAEAFLLAHPHSPLRLRMRSACPELDILAD